MLNQVIEQRSVEDGRGIEFLAGDGSPDDGEDAGTDDSANSQCCQGKRAERFFENAVGIFGIGNQLVYGFAGEQLIGGQWSAPG